MKNVTASLIATAKHNSDEYARRLTKGKDYPVFKISGKHGEEMVTIITDAGTLESWSAFHFTFRAE